MFAFHPHQDRFVADAGAVVAVDDLDPRAATLYPLVETAVQVSLDGGPRLGETAVVVGLGAVGVLVAALLERTGAVVLGSEPEPARRAAAQAFGVRAVGPDEVGAAVAARPGAGAPTWWSSPAAARERWPPRWGCWPMRARSWSAPGTAPSRFPCPWGPTSTAGGWSCAARRSRPFRPPSRPGGTGAARPSWPGG